jgi:histidine phosphotransferase ChpT
MTPPTIDIRIVQLLFSRLCHELAGPIGAVGNGLELVSELADGEDAEALDLIGQSARQAGIALEFARLAFGFGGGSAGPYLRDAERLCKELFGNDRIAVEWRVDTGGADLAKESAKLLVNMALAGEQALRGRGTLSVSVERAAGGLQIDVVAEGPGAALKSEYLDALNGRANLPNLEPATAQGYFTFGLVQLAGGMLTVDGDTADRVALSTVVPDRG